MVLSCPMHLQYYPMDVQTCLIDLASYAYTENDIEYRWKETDPVQLKKGLHSSLPSFQLNNVQLEKFFTASFQYLGFNIFVYQQNKYGNLFMFENYTRITKTIQVFTGSQTIRKAIALC